MDKFTFRLPDRLKLTVEKRSEKSKCSGIQ